MSDANNPPPDAQRDDDQVRTANASSPVGRGQPGDDQLIRTETSITAKIITTQRAISPGTTFSEMTTSTCPVVDSRLDDTSAGRSSSYRSPRPARQSRSRLRESGVVSQRTGVSAARLRSASRGRGSTQTARSSSVHTARSNIATPTAHTARSNIATTPSLHTAPSSSISGAETQPLVHPSQIVARVSPSIATARLQSPRPSITPSQARRLTMTPDEVQALISENPYTPLHTAATQHSASPYKSNASAGGGRGRGSGRGGSTSRSISRSSNSSSAGAGRRRSLVALKGGTLFGRSRPDNTVSSSDSASGATVAGVPASTTPADQVKSSKASPYFEQNSAPVRRVSLTTQQPTSLPRSLENATARSSGHPTAHPITSDTESVGRISLRSSNPASATRTPKPKKSGSRPTTAPGSRPVSAARPASLAKGAPRSGASAPRSTASAPRSVASAPRSTASAPRSRASAPRSTASAPRSVASAPRSAASAPRSTASAPRSTANMPPKKPKFAQPDASKSASTSTTSKRTAKKKALTKKKPTQSLSASSTNSAKPANKPAPQKKGVGKPEMVVTGIDNSGVIRVRVRVQLMDKSLGHEKLKARVTGRLPPNMMLNEVRVLPIQGSSPAN